MTVRQMFGAFVLSAAVAGAGGTFFYSAALGAYTPCPPSLHLSRSDASTEELAVRSRAFEKQWEIYEKTKAERPEGYANHPEVLAWGGIGAALGTLVSVIGILFWLANK